MTYIHLFLFQSESNGKIREENASHCGRPPRLNHLQSTLRLAIRTFAKRIHVSLVAVQEGDATFIPLPIHYRRIPSSSTNVRENLQCTGGFIIVASGSRERVPMRSTASVEQPTCYSPPLQKEPLYLISRFT